MRRILDWFLGREKPQEGPAVLRCKPGGMAWVRGLVDYSGEGDLNGRAVKTVCLNEHGFWVIDPPQSYIAKREVAYPQGLVTAGQVVTSIAICDDCLDPWKEDEGGVSDEEVRDLYEPDRLIAKPATASAIRGH